MPKRQHNEVAVRNMAKFRSEIFEVGWNKLCAVPAFFSQQPFAAGTALRSFQPTRDTSYRKLIQPGTTALSVLKEHLAKLAEQVMAVVRAGRGFGVILHGKRRVIFVPDAFDGLIVEIHVGDFDV